MPRKRISMQKKYIINRCQYMHIYLLSWHLEWLNQEDLQLNQPGIHTLPYPISKGSGGGEGDACL